MRSRTRRLGWFLMVAFAVLWGVGIACAEEMPPDGLAGPRRAVSFTPDTPQNCATFCITEWGLSVLATQTKRRIDRYVLTDALGLMVNLGRHEAVGASAEMRLAGDILNLAPTIRYKHWMKGGQSADLLLGYIAASGRPKSSFRPVGPMLEARYTMRATTKLATTSLRVGVCQYRTSDLDQDLDQDQPEHEKRVLRAYGGLTVGGVPGAAGWGVQLLIFGLVFVGVAALNGVSTG